MTDGMEDLVLSESKSLSESTFQVLLEPEKVNMLVLYFLFNSCYAVEAFFKCSLFI